MTKRRRFSKEFKHEAVQMATGANLSMVAFDADWLVSLLCLSYGQNPQ